MNKSKYAVGLVGLVGSTFAVAGNIVPVGTTVSAVVGTSIAEATGLPIATVGSGAVLAIAAAALVVGIRVLRRKQQR